jgi:abequosyltransferase
MKVLRSYPVLKRSQKDTFDLSDAGERLRYFELADTTEAFFSFIGGIIVKRSKWNAVLLNPAFIGSCWAHAARLFELMPTGLSLKYIHEPLLSKRSGNDSFTTQGFVKRYRITIDGYHAIADRFFGSVSREAYHVRRVVRSEFGLKMFLSAKMACKRNPILEDRKLLDSLLRKTFCDFSIRGLSIQLAYFVIPVWFYAALRKLLKKD